MTPSDRRLMIVANVLVGGTGMVYGVFRYFVTTDDPMALVHPGQPVAHYAHLITAPLLVLAIGHLFHHHGLLSWKAQVRTGRRSGLILLGLALPMIFSGYLLYLATGDFWRPFWIAIHVATSLIWLAGFTAHLFTHARHRTRLRAADWRPE